MHGNRLPPFIRLTKMSPAESAGAPAGCTENYRPGELNPGWSLPVAYEVEGWLLHPPKVGDGVTVLRVSRNGVMCPGVLRTTPVVSVGHREFTTANSTYVWSELG